MKIYFIRHAQSEANVLRIISNRDLPHHLTETGRQQAEALVYTLDNVPVAEVYSSPIVRAVETAQIVAISKGLPVQITNALREPDCGIMEGRGDDAAWAEHDRVVSDWTDHQRDSRIEGGESYNDLRARFVPFVDRLVAEHADTDHNLLLITHGSLLYLMLPLVLTNIDFATVGEYSMNNTIIIIAEKRAAGLVCLEWGDLTVSA
jgi:broad specificity phosphatase PhoE